MSIGVSGGSSIGVDVSPNYWQISRHAFYDNVTLSAEDNPGQYTMDLSEYLPQSGEQYLVLCNTNLNSGNTMVDTDLGKNIAQIYNGLSSPLSFQLILPVGADRQIKLRVYSNLTNFYFQVNAYLKVG